jgi:hypothetical protein
MKKILITLLTIAAIGLVAFFVLESKGYKGSSILNTPETIDLSVSCSQPTNLLVTSEVTVSVQNNSSRTHNNVTVRVTAIDSDGNVIKEKTTTFDRTLEPNGSFSKLITVPAKAKSCNCVLESSDPE